MHEPKYVVNSDTITNNLETLAYFRNAFGPLRNAHSATSANDIFVCLVRLYNICALVT